MRDFLGQAEAAAQVVNVARRGAELVQQAAPHVQRAVQRAAPHVQSYANRYWRWIREDKRRMAVVGMFLAAAIVYWRRRWTVPTFPLNQVPRTPGPSLWPVVLAGKVTSTFGQRIDPTAVILKGTEFHPGVDISAPKGTAVVASGDGTVTFSGTSGGYGNRVVVRHDNGMVSTYNHLAVRQVSTGDKVVTGQAVGSVGTTGDVTGPHLHFEVKDRSGASVNPLAVVSPPGAARSAVA